MSLLPDDSPPIRHEFSPDHQLVMLQDDTRVACNRLPESFFSLVITSPPYNIGKVYETQVALRDYLEEQELVLVRLVELLRPSGSLCWQTGNYVDRGEVFPLDIYFYPIFKRLGLRLRNRIVWHFEHGLHASNRFSGRYETLLWFTKTDEYTFHLDPVRVPSKYPGKLHFKGAKRGRPSGNPLGKNPSDFWTLLSGDWERGILEIPNVKHNHPEKTIHPCQFPVELVERCILAMTDEDDWVLDPFSGAGTTLIAAAKNGRRAVGIDREPEYCALARQRVADYFSGRLKLRPIGRPVHQPSGREKVARPPIEWSETNSKDEPVPPDRCP